MRLVNCGVCVGGNKANSCKGGLSGGEARLKGEKIMESEVTERQYHEQ